MNDYIQKYGQQALQVYKKSLRLSESLDKNSPIKQQPHLLPKKSFSKKSLKSPCQNISKTKLSQSKSIKGLKAQQANLKEQRKKGSSYLESKKIINANGNYSSIGSANNTNGFMHTFNKNLAGQSLLNSNKKKLTLTSQNAKCLTPRGKTNKIQQSHKNSISKEPQNQNMNGPQDRPTERLARQVSKSPLMQNAFAQSKKCKMVEYKLQETLTSRKTVNNLLKGVTQCFQIILSEDDKMRRMFFLIKQIVTKISSIAEKYRLKLRKANQKIKYFKQINDVYIVNDHLKTKSKMDKSRVSEASEVTALNKNKSSIEMIILNQNYELRKKLKKAEKQIQYYTSQQASLMNVLGKFKNNDFQQKNKQNLVSLQQKLINVQNGSRRSSQKLLSKHQMEQIRQSSSKQGIIQKRLSFDSAYISNEQSNIKQNTKDHYNSTPVHVISPLNNNNTSNGLHYGRDSKIYQNVKSNHNVQQLDEEDQYQEDEEQEDSSQCQE